MAHCYYHALSSVRKWGGTVDDYLPLHQWFDQSKAILADPRHRALRHHAEGIFMLVTWTCKRTFCPCCPRVAMSVLTNGMRNALCLIQTGRVLCWLAVKKDQAGRRANPKSWRRPA
jgi:hypothetical protein